MSIYLSTGLGAIIEFIYFLELKGFFGYIVWVIWLLFSFDVAYPAHQWLLYASSKLIFN